MDQIIKLCLHGQHNGLFGRNLFLAVGIGVALVIDIVMIAADLTVRQAEAWNTRLNERSASPLLRACKWTYNPEVKCNAKKTLTREILEYNWTKNLRGNPRFDVLVKKIEELPNEG